jgi:hypothetical protein
MTFTQRPGGSHARAVCRAYGSAAPNNCRLFTSKRRSPRLIGLRSFVYATEVAEMAIEHPQVLLGRLRLGREEYCQRLLTSLIVDGPYPRWNTESIPAPSGRVFLSLLERLSFGEVGDWQEPVFIDELELPKRDEWERGGAPDHAVRDSQRLWLIELKTEAGSHRSDQIPSYFELARHFYPTHRVDITYLTGPLNKPAPPIPDGSRYAHVTWDDVLPLVREVWSGESDVHRQVVRALEDVLGDLATPWPAWRDARLQTPSRLEPVAPPDPIAAALQLARRTAADHEQRALDFVPGSLDALQQLRLDVLRAVRATDETALRHVRPWLWRWASQGQPMTGGGRESGYELRLSWYTNAA